MVAFGTGAIHRILSLFQPPPHISPHKASSSGFLTRLALLLSINSLGCGGAVVPAVDSSMIPQTTHMRALACGVAWQGLFTNHVSRLLAHGSGVAKEAILYVSPTFLVYRKRKWDLWKVALFRLGPLVRNTGCFSHRCC
jgi:hypothetical protein